MPSLYPYHYADTLLKIENVCLSYQGNPVLNGITAEVKDTIRPGQVQGQIVGILGLSGVGKTQLFRIIAGLNPPTSGKVTINGRLDPVRAGEIGVVAQSYPLFAHRSVLSNLKLSVRGQKDVKAATEKVEAHLREFDLWEKRHLYPSQLSGGQKQRVAILQQILCNENFLLMDEPFSGLDIKNEDKVLQLLLKIANLDERNTLIIVTHDISAAVSICDHIWVLAHRPDGQGAALLRNYDLIDAGLCWEQWQSNAQTKPAVAELIRKIKNDFFTL
jgi:NitT/TauT family transport system ATP-binding protein